MKKSIALGMAATVAIGLLTGCGGSPPTPAAGTKAESKATTNSGKTADLTVGMIANAFDIRSYNDNMLAGLELAGQGLGIKGIPLETLEISDSANSIRTLTSQGATFAMVPSSEYKDGMLETAAENPDVKFLYLVEAIDGADNIMSVVYRENEATFLSDALTGTMTKTNSVDTVMTVSETPQYRYQSGFSAGVKAVNPDYEIQSAFTNSHIGVGQSSEVAKVMYNRGADFVGVYAGAYNPSVFNAAKDAGDGKYCLGTANGQFGKVSDKIVTSAVKPMDQVIPSIIKSYMRTGGLDTSRPMLLSLKKGGVKLLFTNNDGLLKTVPEGVMSAVEDLTAKVEPSEIKVPADKSESNNFIYPYAK